MTKLLCNFLWGVSWVIGKLPQKVHFLMGDILYVILYKCLKYRVNVVRNNLANSFPDKSSDELKVIEKNFYRHLADVFIETLTLVSMTEKHIRERMVFDNVEVISDIPNAKGAISAMAHYATWEHTISFSLNVQNPVKAVYHPLSDKSVDLFFYKLRSRFGTLPVPMSMTSREVLREIKRGNKPIVALIADQTPPYPLIKNWIPFLNQPTPFFYGMERMALSLNMAVSFAHIRQTKRGYYSCHFTSIYDGVSDVEDGYITNKYAEELEKIIIEAPHLWMWSHRRWKYTPADVSI